MFEVAALGLALMHELAEPYPGSATSRSDVLDLVYDDLAGTDPDRRDRYEWAVRAGGEVR